MRRIVRGSYIFHHTRYKKYSSSFRHFLSFGCRSRALNLLYYGLLGGRELLQRTYKNLDQRVRLEVRRINTFFCLVPVKFSYSVRCTWAVRESSFNMTREGDEDIEGGLRKFLDTRKGGSEKTRGGSENLYTSKPTGEGWLLKY